MTKTKEELNNTKYELIQKTIGECYKANKRFRPTKTTYSILSYSLVLVDDDCSERFMRYLVKNDHLAALDAYVESHSLEQVKEACACVSERIVED